MSAFDEMMRQLAVVNDMFSQMAPDAYSVTDQSDLIDELTVEEFDPSTINEAEQLLSTAAAAIQATEAAFLSAEPLRTALGRL